MSSGPFEVRPEHQLLVLRQAMEETDAENRRMKAELLMTRSAFNQVRQEAAELLAELTELHTVATTACSPTEADTPT